MEELRGMEWVAWKRSEQTQEFLSRLRQSVSEIQAEWLNNAYMADDQFRTLMSNAGALAATGDEVLGQIVRREEAMAWDMNISGVPAFIVNGKYMIPGAQDADTFVRVLEKVMEKEAA